MLVDLTMTISNIPFTTALLVSVSKKSCDSFHLFTRCTLRSFAPARAAARPDGAGTEGGFGGGAATGGGGPGGGGGAGGPAEGTGAEE